MPFCLCLDHFNPHQLVGAIHLQQGRQDQALGCFRKITQHCPSDMDAWLEVGELLVSSDLPAALESLKKAYERMVKAAGKEGVPWQLVNNIGALHHERGAYEVGSGLVQPGQWWCDAQYLMQVQPGQWWCDAQYLMQLQPGQWWCDAQYLRRERTL
ncbi:unnamed protein product [Closterium sp. NIES-53]